MKAWSLSARSSKNKRVILWGRAMQRRFEQRPTARARLRLDPPAIERLARSTARVGLALPFVIALALVPDGQGVTRWETLPIMLASLGAALAGLFAILGGRAWGLVLLVGAAAASACGVIADGGLAVPLVAAATLLGVLDVMSGRTWALVVIPLAPLGRLLWLGGGQPSLGLPIAVEHIAVAASAALLWSVVPLAAPVARALRVR
jgi:hypothetical protein